MLPGCRFEVNQSSDVEDSELPSCSFDRPGTACNAQPISIMYAKLLTVLMVALMLVASICCLLSVTLCIEAKRCVLE